MPSSDAGPQAIAWNIARRIALIGVGPHDLPDAGRQLMDVLTEEVPGSGWVLTQIDPVGLTEYPVATGGHVHEPEHLDLHTTDGRLTGRLTASLGPADTTLLETAGMALAQTLLGGIVDWMRGPIWMTTGQPGGEHARS